MKDQREVEDNHNWLKNPYDYLKSAHFWYNRESSTNNDEKNNSYSIRKNKNTKEACTKRSKSLAL